MRDPTAQREWTGEELARALRHRMTLAAITANGLGALDVFLLLAVLVPASDSADTGPSTTANAIFAAAFLVVSFPVAIQWSYRRALPIQSWLKSGAVAGDVERAAVLRQPLDFALVSGVFWGLAAAAFAVFNSGDQPGRVVVVGMTIALGGLSTCAFGYLVAERIMRPATARALAGDPPTRPVGPGVAARMTMAWILATGVPVLGLAAVGDRAVGGRA